MGGEGFTDGEALAKGVDPQDLRALALASLFAANALAVDVTALDWQCEVLRILERECGAYCDRQGRAPKPLKSKPSRRKGHDDLAAKSIAEPRTTGVEFGLVPVVTVHAVKGETHDATVLVVPPTAGKRASKRCPTLIWWPTGKVGDDSHWDDEERRIAYVALTRSRGDVVLCVDRPAYDRLVARQPDFVGAFECCDVAEFLACLEARGVGDAEACRRVRPGR